MALLPFLGINCPGFVYSVFITDCDLAPNAGLRLTGTRSCAIEAPDNNTANAANSVNFVICDFLIYNVLMV
jgi:hypothetical protein